MSSTVHRYGPDPEQRGELWLPGGAGRVPVAVLLHGGFWRAGRTCALMRPLAADLALRGWAAWNLEYRRVGQPGGGWPGTADDVAAGIDALAGLARGTALLPAAVVSLAGVADLVAGAADALGDGAVEDFMGAAPAGAPQRYAAASPLARVPLGVPTLLAHGDADDKVPIAQSRAYAAAAAAAVTRCTCWTCPAPATWS